MTPDRERPSYRDRPELLSWQVSLLCVELTPFTSFDDVDSILLSRQPEKTVPERLGDQRLCRHVMPTFAGVDFLKDLSPFFWRNTSLKNAGRAPFIKQKTAYEILRSDWSSDVCSSDLAFAGVNFLKDLSPLFWRNTSLKNAGRTPFIKLSVDDCVRLCSACDTSPTYL